MNTFRVYVRHPWKGHWMIWIFVKHFKPWMRALNLRLGGVSRPVEILFHDRKP